MEPNINNAPDDDALPLEAEEALSPMEQAALEALFSEPFPAKPYALAINGDDLSSETTDYLVHQDEVTGKQCLFVFDSVVDAMTAAEEFKQTLGGLEL